MTATLLLVLKLSIVALIFAVGLGSTPADLMYLWRRPRELLRSLLAMYVAVPLVALLVAKMLPLPVAVKTAILVLAISAGAPLLPKKLMKIGREGYVFSLVVTSSLLAIVVVPAWLAFLDPLFGREVSVKPGAVALVIAKVFLAPLLAGMLLRWPLSRIAERLSERILGVGGAALILAGLSLLALHWRLLVDIGWIPLLALTAMTAVALAVGHSLGGPDPADRTALAVSCASRHVGIAMLAASTVPGPRTIALVLMYVFASAAVSIPYMRWRARAGDRGLAAGSITAAAGRR
jgi:bile acid:Na+ symporter, BASS family